MFIRKQRRSKSSAAFGLPETIIAMAIAALAMSGAMAINSHQLRLVKSTREASAASHALQERIEQVRTATWKQITDPIYVSQTLFSSLPRSIAPLDGYRETITITPWPETSALGPSPLLCVEKTPKQSAQIISAGSGIGNARLVKVDIQIKWGGNGNRERSRELTTILSNGGISRMNLPAMGPLGGGALDEVSTTQGTSSGIETGNSGSDSSGSGDSKSGGKSGRGNIGGASGKK
jgi:type II secretory pathway pseudopilin PulG